MNLALVFGTNVVRKAYSFLFSSRKFCNGNFGGDEFDNGFLNLDLDCGIEEETSISEHGSFDREEISVRSRFFESAKLGASRVLETVQKDESGFNTNLALDELNVRVSGLLVREVTWIEQAEYDETHIQQICRGLIGSGGLDAKRWLTTLQRQTESISTLTSINMDQLYPGLSSKGAREIVRVAQRMVLNYYTSISGSSVIRWESCCAVSGLLVRESCCAVWRNKLLCSS